MAMFQLDIAFMLELAAFAGGLIVLHFGREKGSGLLKWAAVVLLVGSVLTALCSSYFGIRYHILGDFDRAYPAHRMAVPGGGHMHPGGHMAPGGPMTPGARPPMGGPGMMQPGAPAPMPEGSMPEAEGSHEEHHPD